MAFVRKPMLPIHPHLLSSAACISATSTSDLVLLPQDYRLFPAPQNRRLQTLGVRYNQRPAASAVSYTA
ncbi:hypothetical protein D9M72_558850 [compost metagenome]